jgi:hypothetical protein
MIKMPAPNSKLVTANKSAVTEPVRGSFTPGNNPAVASHPLPDHQPTVATQLDSAAKDAQQAVLSDLMPVNTAEEALEASELPSPDLFNNLHQDNATKDLKAVPSASSP